MATRSRIPSVDVVRGGVMILMTLDHVRDYVTNLRIRPEDLSQSTAGLFATRWITHFCAPTFFLLAGVGIGLGLARGKGPAEMSRYLVVRGVWLIALELVFTAVGWQFGFQLIPGYALVVWALGWSMIVMAALIHLPRGVVLAGGLLLIAFHNLLDPIQPQALGAFAPLWHVLHVPGVAIPGILFVGYPLIPWVGVMAVGYVLADVYAWTSERRHRFLVGTGLAVCAAFVALRFINAYGDLSSWSVQRSAALTVASFLNTSKYPPSLLFLLMTLGPVLLALAFVERLRGRVASWLTVYGSQPLFFYVLHIYVIHLVAMIVAFIQGGELRRIPVVTNPGAIPDWYGLSLPGVYAVWVLVVLLMYAPCRWYARDRGLEGWRLGKRREPSAVSSTS